jgi:hypothetical protein
VPGPCRFGLSGVHSPACAHPRERVSAAASDARALGCRRMWRGWLELHRGLVSCIGLADRHWPGAQSRPCCARTIARWRACVARCLAAPASAPVALSHASSAAMSSSYGARARSRSSTRRSSRCDSVMFTNAGILGLAHACVTVWVFDGTLPLMEPPAAIVSRPGPMRPLAAASLADVQKLATTPPGRRATARSWRMGRTATARAAPRDPALMADPAGQSCQVGDGLIGWVGDARAWFFRGEDVSGARCGRLGEHALARCR